MAATTRQAEPGDQQIESDPTVVFLKLIDRMTEKGWELQKAHHQQLERVATANTQGTLFFWQADKEAGPQCCLANYYQAPFVDSKIDEEPFHNVEQYLHYLKSALADDHDSMAKLRAEKAPNRCRALGKAVKNLDVKAWDAIAVRVVERGLYLKFSQNKDLGDYLMAQGNMELVEASPYDSTWGIGLSADKAITTPRAQWGRNLLGKGVMRTGRWRLRYKIEPPLPIKLDSLRGGASDAIIGRGMPRAFMRLAQHLRAKRKQVVDCGGQGQCFFNSVAYCLAHRGRANTTGQEIRTRIVRIAERMLNAIPDFAVELEMALEDWPISTLRGKPQTANTWLQLMILPTTYVDNLGVGLVATLFEVDIIYYDVASSGDPSFTIHPREGTAAVDIVELAFERDVHYCAIIPVAFTPDGRERVAADIIVADPVPEPPMLQLGTGVGLSDRPRITERGGHRHATRRSRRNLAQQLEEGAQESQERARVALACQLSEQAIHPFESAAQREKSELQAAVAASCQEAQALKRTKKERRANRWAVKMQSVLSAGDEETHRQRVMAEQQQLDAAIAESASVPECTIPTIVSGDDLVLTSEDDTMGTIPTIVSGDDLVLTSEDDTMVDEDDPSRTVPSDGEAFMIDGWNSKPTVASGDDLVLGSDSDVEDGQLSCDQTALLAQKTSCATIASTSGSRKHPGGETHPMQESSEVESDYDSSNELEKWFALNLPVEAIKDLEEIPAVDALSLQTSGVVVMPYGIASDGMERGTQSMVFLPLTPGMVWGFGYDQQKPAVVEPSERLISTMMADDRPTAGFTAGTNTDSDVKLVVVAMSMEPQDPWATTAKQARRLTMLGFKAAWVAVALLQAETWTAMWAQLAVTAVSHYATYDAATTITLGHEGTLRSRSGFAAGRTEYKTTPLTTLAGSEHVTAKSLIETASVSLQVLRDRLREVDGEDAGYYHLWADALKPLRVADISPDLLVQPLAIDDERLARELFTGPLPIYETPWLERMPRQVWSHSKECTGFTADAALDLLDPLAVEMLKVWFAQMIKDLECLELLGPACDRRDKPAAVAIGQDQFKPCARGYLWDCRQRPCKLLDVDEAIDTDWKLSYLRDKLQHYPDQRLASNILEGIRLEADLELMAILCPQLVSIGEGYDSVQVTIRELRDKGFYGFFHNLPFMPIVVIGQGSRVKKLGSNKYRRTSDFSAPHKPLYDATGQRAVPINEASKSYAMPNWLLQSPRAEVAEWARRKYEHVPLGAAGEEPSPRYKFPKEHKPLLGGVMRNIAILLHAAWRMRQPIFVWVEDAAFYFNQFGYAAEELWKSNLIVSARPEDIAQNGHSFEAGQLVFVAEKRLGFGSYASSNIAQRFSNALTAWTLEEFDRLESMARASSYQPDWEAWISDRQRLEAKCRESRPKKPREALSDCTQTRLATLDMYSDDPVAVVVGVERAMRLLQAWRKVTGSVNLEMAGADKRQLGGDVEWVGVLLLAAIGLVAVPTNKLLRARHALLRTIAGEITFGEYRSLVGLLEHLRFITRLPGDSTNALYHPHRRGGESQDGPNAVVVPNALMLKRLHQWLDIIMHCAGAAVTIVFVDNATEKLRDALSVVATSSDAAGDGRGEPGIGGYTHGFYWRVGLQPAGLACLHITAWETLAAIVNLMVAARLAGPRTLLAAQTDALLTPYALSKLTSKSIDIQLLLDEALSNPRYAEDVGPRAVIRHISGEGNLPSDLTSRALWTELEWFCNVLRVRPVLVPLEQDERNVVLKAVSRIAAQHKLTYDPADLLFLDEAPLGETTRAQRGIETEEAMQHFSFPLVSEQDLHAFLAAHPQLVDLVVFEFSGALVTELWARGRMAISVDKRAPQHHLPAYQGDFTVVLQAKQWDRVYFVGPPCFQHMVSDYLALPHKIADGRAYWGGAMVVRCICTPTEYAKMVLVEQPDTLVHYHLDDEQVPGLEIHELYTTQLGDARRKFMRFFTRNVRLTPLLSDEDVQMDDAYKRPSIHDYEDAEQRDRDRSTWQHYPNLCKWVAGLQPLCADGMQYVNHTQVIQQFIDSWTAMGYPVPPFADNQTGEPLDQEGRKYQMVRGKGDGRRLSTVDASPVTGASSDSPLAQEVIQFAAPSHLGMRCRLRSAGTPSEPNSPPLLSVEEAANGQVVYVDLRPDEQDSVESVVRLQALRARLIDLQPSQQALARMALINGSRVLVEVTDVAALDLFRAWMVATMAEDNVMGNGLRKLLLQLGPWVRLLGGHFICPRLTEYEPRVTQQQPHMDVGVRGEVVGIGINLLDEPMNTIIDTHARLDHNGRMHDGIGFRRAATSAFGFETAAVHAGPAMPHVGGPYPRYLTNRLFFLLSSEALPLARVSQHRADNDLCGDAELLIPVIGPSSASPLAQETIQHAAPPNLESKHNAFTTLADSEAHDGSIAPGYVSRDLIDADYRCYARSVLAYALLDPPTTTRPVHEVQSFQQAAGIPREVDILTRTQQAVIMRHYRFQDVYVFGNTAVIYDCWDEEPFKDEPHPNNEREIAYVVLQYHPHGCLLHLCGHVTPLSTGDGGRCVPLTWCELQSWIAQRQLGKLIVCTALDQAKARLRAHWAGVRPIVAGRLSDVNEDVLFHIVQLLLKTTTTPDAIAFMSCDHACRAILRRLALVIVRLVEFRMHGDEVACMVTLQAAGAPSLNEVVRGAKWRGRERIDRVGRFEADVLHANFRWPAGAMVAHVGWVPLPPAYRAPVLRLIFGITGNTGVMMEAAVFVNGQVRRLSTLLRPWEVANVGLIANKAQLLAAQALVRDLHTNTIVHVDMEARFGLVYSRGWEVRFGFTIALRLRRERQSFDNNSTEGYLEVQSAVLTSVRTVAWPTRKKPGESPRDDDPDDDDHGPSGGRGAAPSPQGTSHSHGQAPNAAMSTQSLHPLHQFYSWDGESPREPLGAVLDRTPQNSRIIGLEWCLAGVNAKVISHHTLSPSSCWHALGDALTVPAHQCVMSDVDSAGCQSEVRAQYWARVHVRLNGHHDPIQPRGSLSRQPIIWTIGGVAVTDPTTAQLQRLGAGDHVFLSPPRSKTDSFGVTRSSPPRRGHLTLFSSLSSTHEVILKARLYCLHMVTRCWVKAVYVLRELLGRGVCPCAVEYDGAFVPTWAARAGAVHSNAMASFDGPTQGTQIQAFVPAWAASSGPAPKACIHVNVRSHPYKMPAYGKSPLRTDQVEHAKAFAQRLANDTTAGRIAAPLAQLEEMALAVAEARADGINPRTASKDEFAMREFVTFAGLSGFDPNLRTEWTKQFVERESLKLASFLLFRAQRAVPRSKQDVVAKPMSIYQNYLALRRVFKSRDVELPPPGTVRETLRGLLKRFIRRFGIEKLRPKRVEPVTPDIVRKVLRAACAGGGVVGGTDWTLQNWVCFVVVCWMVVNLSVGSRKGESTQLPGDCVLCARLSTKLVR